MLLFLTTTLLCATLCKARWAAVSTTLSSRSTKDVLHDKFFIPAVAAMGVLVIVALLCWYKIATTSEGYGRGYPRQVNWAAPLHGVQGDYPPIAPDDTNEQTLGRRMSKVQRKPPPPLLASATYTPPHLSGLGHADYPSQPQQIIPQAQVGGSNEHGRQPSSTSGPWAPQHVDSVFSSGQSSTQVGSDQEPVSPYKTKPFSAGGGYGFSNQPHAGQTQSAPQNPEFGLKQGMERSQPSTYASNYNPYDGIDPSYNPNNPQRGQSAIPRSYPEPHNSGAAYYDSKKRTS